MIRLAAIALSLGALAAPAAAAEEQWWWLGTFYGLDNKQNTYVDRNSIRRDGRQVAMTRFDFTRAPFSNGEQYSVALHVYDCKQRTTQLVARTAWDKAGKLMGTHSWQGVKPEPVKPETAGDVVWRYACGKGELAATAVGDPLKHSLAQFQMAAVTEDAAPQTDPVGYGTGFFVNQLGQLVTSHHVVEGAKSILVYTADGQRHPAELVRTSSATDLAVLRVRYRPSHFLGLSAANSAKPGDKVFTFGFPVMELLGSEPKFTDGAISSLSGAGDEAAFAQISVPVQPGNSGGPVVNERGEVVGVVAATAAVLPFLKATGSVPQNIGWAVRAEYLVPLIERSRAPALKSRDEAVDVTRRSVALVVVQR